MFDRMEQPSGSGEWLAVAMQIFDEVPTLGLPLPFILLSTCSCPSPCMLYPCRHRPLTSALPAFCVLCRSACTWPYKTEHRMDVGGRCEHWAGSQDLGQEGCGEVCFAQARPNTPSLLQHMLYRAICLMITCVCLTSCAFEGLSSRICCK